MRFMEITPRKTKLYNQIAKDYNPKKAAMQMCSYMEKLEKRIVALEEKEIKKTQPKSSKKTETSVSEEQ